MDGVDCANRQTLGWDADDGLSSQLATTRLLVEALAGIAIILRGIIWPRASRNNAPWRSWCEDGAAVRPC